ETCRAAGARCVTRAEQAWARATTGTVNQNLEVVLDSREGSVVLHEGEALHRFTPLADGKPLLKGCQLLWSDKRRFVLEFLVHGEAGPAHHILRLPDGVPLARLSAPFALSPDGSHIARLTAGGRSVVVEAV